MSATFDNAYNGARDLLTNAGDSISGAYDTVKDKVSNNKTINDLLTKLKANPDVQRALITALATGGLGAAATMVGGKREGETSGEKRSRMLRNALFAAAAGGGGMYALSKGLPDLLKPIDKKTEDATAKAIMEGVHATRAMSSDVLTHPATMAAGGVAGLHAANPGILRPSRGHAATNLQPLIDKAAPTSASDQYLKDMQSALKKKDGAGALARLKGLGTDNFRGIDFDTISSNTSGGKMGDIARQLIKDNGGGANGAAYVKRMLNEAGVAHGDYGLWNSIKSTARGISDRSGITDAYGSVANSRVARAFKDNAPLDIVDRYKQTPKTSAIPVSAVSQALKDHGKIPGGWGRLGKGATGFGAGALIPYLTGKLLKPSEKPE